MKKIRNFPNIITTAILSSFSLTAAASDFNIPFINASGLGDTYAGWAVSASDASTAYANPAGLVKLCHQQLVFAALGLKGHARFEGTTTPPFPPAPPQVGSATSPLSALMPSFYYALPLSPNLVAGFSMTTPFALSTSYPKNSIVRYAATRNVIATSIHLGPSIGFAINNGLSVGAGFDIVRLNSTFGNMYGFPISVPDSEVQNHLYGWGYGWHAGILYQAAPCTRIGFNFKSHVVVHANGHSQIWGPAGDFRVNNQSAVYNLPALATLSIKQDLNPCLALLGTVFYTNWSTLNQIVLQNTLIPGGGTIPVTLPFEYHDTFDYSIGLNYRPCDQWIFKIGTTYLNTPTNDRTRVIQDPVADAIILGIGAHYQQNPCLGYDIGYNHAFFRQKPINYVTPLTTAVGNIQSQSNIFGVQVNWNIS